MQKIVGGKRYDTKTATKVAEGMCPPGGCGDGDWIDFWKKEHLYRTKNGNYFVSGKGGIQTEWATIDLLSRDAIDEGGGIVVLTAQEAVGWLEKWDIPVPEGCPELEELVTEG